MKTLTQELKKSIRKVLELCQQAVINNDYNLQTIKAINACSSKIKPDLKHNIKTSRYVLMSNIDYMLKLV